MTTLSLQVSAGNCDGTEHLNTEGWRWGEVVIGETTLLSSMNSGAFNLMRFTGVTVPKNAVISAATVQVYLTNSKDLTLQVFVCSEKVANSPVLTTVPLSISSRSKTPEGIWSGTGSVNTWLTSPSFPNIVQEVVDLVDWVSGNPLSVIFRTNTSGNPSWMAWEGSPSQATKLNITYAVSVPPPTLRGYITSPGVESAPPVLRGYISAPGVESAPPVFKNRV